MESCERLPSTAIAGQLRQLALEYRHNIDDLKHMVGEQNIEPKNGRPEESAGGRLDSSVAFASDEADTVIAESARMAGQIKQQYQDCIVATRPLSELLPKQYARVKRAVDALRMLRVRNDAK